MKILKNIAVVISGFLVLFEMSCAKFFVGETHETRLTWKFTRKFCECPDGTYFNDTIWPAENKNTFITAEVSYFNNNPDPATFHFLVNGEIQSIQQFNLEERFDAYHTGPNSYNPGLPSLDDFRYSIFRDNPNSDQTSFWLGVWTAEGSISSGLSFTPDFPYSNSHDFNENDTILYNFFVRENIIHWLFLFADDDFTSNRYQHIMSCAIRFGGQFCWIISDKNSSLHRLQLGNKAKTCAQLSL